MAQKDNSEIIQENIVLHGDCLELMKDIDDKSIDMILCDLPYGTTECKWDICISFEPLWVQYKRIIKDRGAIVLTAVQPFTSALVMSNVKMYKHCWVWNKNNSAGFSRIKFRPFGICEDILVFGKNRVNYYPIMEIRGKPRIKGGYLKSDTCNIVPVKSKSNIYYPKNLINISNASQKGKVVPTQKPVPLFEYLIRTYTNEGDLVLDNCAGSGTTAIACMNTGRDYILMEKEQKHIDIINERIAKHRKQLTLKM
jgi:site-specific DNA-methyltransferase (adenine-specific)